MPASHLTPLPNLPLAGRYWMVGYVAKASNFFIFVAAYGLFMLCAESGEGRGGGKAVAVAAASATGCVPDFWCVWPALKPVPNS